MPLSWHFQTISFRLWCTRISLPSDLVLSWHSKTLAVNTVLLHTRVVHWTKPNQTSVTHRETLAVIWAFQHFRDIILSYPISVFTDHAAVTDLFFFLQRWYLTIQEFNITLNYAPGRAKVVVDSLSRKVPVGVVTNHHAVTENFSLDELRVAQCNRGVWSKVIDTLKSDDETKSTGITWSFKTISLVWRKGFVPLLA